MHPKQANDPFYKHLTDEEARQAGYFNYSGEWGAQEAAISALLATTPVHRVATQLAQCKRPAILVATGCFAPIHQGHIDMMKNARMALLAKGYDGVVGYFAPDHDEYVSTKKGGAEWSIEQRSLKINAEIREQWMEIDYWPSLVAPFALNFSDILVRLQKNIQSMTGLTAPIFLVVGGDNARFVKAFEHPSINEMGFGCVVVSRPGYRIPQCASKLAKLPNIFFTRGATEMSSSCIRASTSLRKKARLCIRVRRSHPEEMRLVEVIRPYFQSVKIVYAENQKIPDSKRKVISLDCLKLGDYNLKMSRLYDAFGTRKIGFTERPCEASLLKQVENIPSGEYDLWDDDIFTGRTIQFAKQVLATRDIYIKNEYSGLSSRDGTFDEILDARDFCIGSGGGLVVSIRGVSQRVPYILPYIHPTLRASVLDAKGFSAAVKNFNNNELHNKSV